MVKNRIYQTIFISVLMLICCGQIVAQSHAGYVSATFVKHHTQQPLSSVASNLLRINNASLEEMEFELDLHYPSGWRRLGQRINTITIPAKDSVFIPVRFVIPADAYSDKAYQVGVDIYSNGFNIAKDRWYIELEKIIDWRIQLETQKFVFRNENDTASVKLYAFNAGNAKENIHVNFKAINNYLKVIDGHGNELTHSQFVLGVGIDTAIQYTVVYSKEFKGESEYDLIDKEANIEKSSLRITAYDDNPKTSSRWNGSVTFEKVPNKYKYSLSSSNNLPLTLDFNSYNLLDDNTFLSLTAYGQKNVKEASYLNYHYQTNFISNYVDWNTFAGQYHYLGYFSPTWRGELGNVMLGNGGINLSGVGIKGGYKFNQHFVSAGFVNMPKLSNNYLGSGGAAEYEFRSLDGRLKAEAYVQYKNETFLDRQIFAFVPFVSYRTKDRHYFKLQLGYSQENREISKMGITALQGYSYKFNYSGMINKLRVNFMNRWSNPNYAGGKGMLNVSANFNYNLDANKGLSLRVNHTALKPDVYSIDTLFYSGVRSKIDRVELRYKESRGDVTYMLKPTFEYTNYLGLENTYYGIGSDVYFRTPDLWTYNLSGLAGVNVLKNTIVSDPYFTAMFRGSMRYSNLYSASIRYLYGPYYYSQRQEFSVTGKNMQSVFFNLNLNYWFANNRARIRNGAYANYITTNDRLSMHYRPEVFYYLGKGFRISAYGQVSVLNSTTDSENVIDDLEYYNITKNSYKDFEAGIGLKKSFGVPVSLKKYYDATFKAFKDDNANGKKEREEDGVKNILVELLLISYMDAKGNLIESLEPVQYEVLTNKAGDANFENLPRGTYQMSVIPLNGMARFYSGTSQDIVLNTDKFIPVPFANSASISGTLRLERSHMTHLSKPVRLGSIKIIATGENGVTYSTLTDSQGGFRIDVPAGKYTISLNEDILGRNLLLKENDIVVNLNDVTDNSFVTFYLIEKERKLNIKRFD